MPEDRWSIGDDYHLKFGGILHNLGFAKYFTADASSVGLPSFPLTMSYRWKPLLLMICHVRRLTLATNSVNNLKSHLLLPYRGGCCTMVFLETILFANSDLRWELRWISVELNCVESCRVVPVISDGSYAVMYWYSFRGLVVIDKRLNSLACKYWPFLICHPRKDRLTYYFGSQVENMKVFG